jgi:hypothetical protein
MRRPLADDDLKPQATLQTGSRPTPGRFLNSGLWKPRQRTSPGEDRHETGLAQTPACNIPGGDAPQGCALAGPYGPLRSTKLAVFVLDKRKKPLMPCSETRARLLLTRGRAGWSLPLHDSLEGPRRGRWSAGPGQGRPRQQDHGHRRHHRGAAAAPSLRHTVFHAAFACAPGPFAALGPVTWCEPNCQKVRRRRSTLGGSRFVPVALSERAIATESAPSTANFSIARTAMAARASSPG